MQPWGTITGRVLGEAGMPLADAALVLTAGGADSVVQAYAKTDARGQFRAERVIPGLSYSAKIYQGRRQLAPVTDSSVEKLVLRPGEARDLGDIRTKPAAGPE